MKSVDTNVLVRLLTGDDPDQARIAASEMSSSPIYLATTVLLETEWVLRHAYGFSAPQINLALTRLISLDGATVQSESAVRSALRWHAQGMDFADALHLASSHGAEELISFDRRLVSRAAITDSGVRARLL